MEFEFDAVKSASNKEKHGIDFLHAWQLFEDDLHCIITTRSSDEPRFLLIARLNGVYWTAVYTPRKGKIRFISVRRSRDDEKQIYDQGC